MVADHQGGGHQRGIETLSRPAFSERHHDASASEISANAAALAAASPALSRLAWGQAYPARPVHLLCGFPPGSSQDIVARIIGEWLSARLGEPVVIDNRPGAGGNIAVETVVNARRGRLHAL